MNPLSIPAQHQAHLKQSLPFLIFFRQKYSSLFRVFFSLAKK